MTPEELEEADRRRYIGLKILQQASMKDGEDGFDPEKQAINIMDMRLEDIADDDVTENDKKE